VIYFTPDLQRVVYKLCEKFEVKNSMASSFLNYPLLDKMMFNVGEKFCEKLVLVSI
jgi:hypothetical protein